MTPAGRGGGTRTRKRRRRRRRRNSANGSPICPQAKKCRG